MTLALMIGKQEASWQPLCLALSGQAGGGARTAASSLPPCCAKMVMMAPASIV